MGEAWFFVVAIGPLLLVLAILWVWLRNRAADRPGDEARTEEATRRLREDIQRDPQYREE